MSAIVVNGCELEAVAPATGDIEITNSPSEDITVNDNGVFFKEIAFSVSNSNGGGSVTNNDGSGTGKIKATCTTVTDADGNGVILVTDVSDSVTINGTKPSSSGSVPASGTITVKIKKAGQSDVEVS